MMRKAYGWALAPTINLAALALLAATSGLAQAADIGWEKHGAFQACLDAKAKAWLQAKVELVVNDDPNMGALDDKTVAGWAAGALQDCAAKAPGADAASERQFMRYMASWRD